MIELWHFNFKRIKKEVLAICVWLRRKFQIRTETIIDAGGISYGSLGACHMWRTVLGESGIQFGWHHEGRKSYGGKTILEGERQWNSTIRQVSLQLFSALVLAPVLQDSALDKSIMLSIRLKISTQDFYYYRLGRKPTS